MATNDNLIRNGFVKNWEFKNFPQKKIVYSKQIIFTIKVYFWLRFLLLYYKIRLVQFNSNLLEGGIISCDLVINRSSFKSRNIKFHGAEKKFLELNRIALKVFHYYKNIIKICNLYKIKRNKIQRFLRRRCRRKKYKKKTLFHKSKRTLLQLSYTGKNTKVDLVNSSKTFLVLNYLKFKKFLISQKHNSLNRNRLWLPQKFLKKNKNNNLLIKKKVFTKLKKYKILNKKLMGALGFNPIKKIKKKFYLNKTFSLIKIKIILEREIYKFLLIRCNIRLRFEPLIYPLILETERLRIRNKFSSQVLFKFTKNLYYKNLKLPKLVFTDISDYNDYFWKRSRRKFFRHWKFKRVEKILMAAIWYNNLQILVDFLALEISKSRHHTKPIIELCKQLKQLFSHGSTPMFRYRIGLYGRVNNSARRRASFFTAGKDQKVNQGTFTTKLYFAEARTTAVIGGFHIRIWFELLNNN